MKYLITSYNVTDRNVIIFKPDSWDDFGFKTLFDAIYVDKEGKRIELGSIKIAKSGIDEGYTKDYLEQSFVELSSDFFSLWQSAESYQKVRKIEEKYEQNIFEELNDIAYNLKLLEKYGNQKALNSSLLRFVSVHMCVNQFHRISHGEALLTSYSFNYIVKQKEKGYQDCKLRFEVEPDSLPPTNVHALIGSNGTGKTTLIKNMIKSICGNKETNGEFEYPNLDNSKLGYFESIMCVSFSPFDDYSEIEDYKNFKYIGVQKKYEGDGLNDEQLNLLDDIKNKFIDSFKSCMSNKTKKQDWITIIEMLSTDGDFLFGKYNIGGNLTESNLLSHKNTENIEKIFDNMSAGHKEVLSIVTRCIDQLAEKTILFLDEPENHLHPPLLSSMIRGISKMLIKRNSVAIISTHSPIVLQEIPKSCVWILNREEDYLQGNRPQVETFGTNVGVLTNEVFGYEVKKSGFNALLRKVVAENNTYDEVLERFNGELGDEARSIVRALLAQKGEND